MTNINFKNKTVVITGGSKGIGLEITKTFLKHQANVIILARNKPKRKIQSKDNAGYFIECDIRNTESIDSAIKDIASKYKSIDVLINNAGGAPMADSLTASPKFHEAIIDLNLTAPLNLSQKIAKKMIKQKTVSNIINISSVTATRPTPGSAAYGAAKGALVNLTKTLAVEWAPKIKVNSIIVGYIETENSILHYGSKSEIKKVAQTIPLKRMGQPQDVANACVFFASDLAEWVTGSALEVHGGGESPAYLDVAKPK
ncbi:SDR family oxidoreductase [Gammaproteobacteria bacterium]|nr:SDR family oxidoreductase [Gammaproteobacteria bacterium]MDB9896860.1 SDR family oxidoreductase [Gammaproteobacteria bacterium]MDC0891997.1 SDR family oxidoreductase [Gammaproteobacteria bacterium]MDC1009178.1 SDR family oxidoreductase [Gammaproteobacteria bacterium]MDC1108253.1 SDR family oxidoreductase [Gammaproteobacteria bacterium]